MVGFHFAFLFIWLIYAILLLGGGFIAGYGFRKGWERAAPRKPAEPRNQI